MEWKWQRKRKIRFIVVFYVCDKSKEMESNVSKLL